MKCEDCKKKVLTREYYSYRLKKTLDLCEECRWHRSRDDQYLYTDPDDCWNMNNSFIGKKMTRIQQRWESSYFPPDTKKTVTLDYDEGGGKYTLTINNLTNKEIYDLDIALLDAFTDIHNPIVESIFDVIQQTIGDST